MLGSTCLERKVPEMLSLWTDIFNGLLLPNEAKTETTTEGLKSRLTDLISMSAVNYKNSLAHGGHHYSMAHAASKLKHLPALGEREKQSGISMFRRLTALSESPEEVSLLLSDLSVMSRKLLSASNIETFSISATPQKSQDILEQFGNFVTDLPTSQSTEAKSLKDAKEASNDNDKHTYFISPFMVHFSSIALPGVHYTHPDSAALRVLSRIISSKYLHVEIREKGGAYGGGCSASPTSAAISFFSYRDPNFERTLETFHNSNDWIQKGKESFGQTDVDEAKLSVFKALDKPILPGARGLRIFLSGITDEQFENHRRLIREVTFADIQRVSEKYLGQSRDNAFSTTLGPEPQDSLNHKVETLIKA